MPGTRSITALSLLAASLAAQAAPASPEAASREAVFDQGFEQEFWNHLATLKQ